MKNILVIASVLYFSFSNAQSYPPASGTEGSTAIEPTSTQFVAWATGVVVERGYVNISNPDLVVSGSNRASAGLPENAIGPATGSIVSLGDRGTAIMTFALPIINGNGPDFAVFENTGPAFLELAFVEVSSDGINFFRFPTHSQTQTETQIGSFGTPVATYLNNFAGKYGSKGVPFDLSDLPENTLLDKNNITHVKVVDVVGSINPLCASYDTFGNAVNESWPTPFNSGGFDLDAVGVINQATLGIDDLHKKSIYLYPNPANDRVFINSEVDVAIKIYDISGRIVLDIKNLSNGGIDISSLKSGVYLAEINTENKTNTLQLVKR